MEDETENHHLTEDVVMVDILPRLPAKSLFRFKCVSKKWNDFISHDPSFPQKQSQCFSSFSGLLFHNPQGSELGLGLTSPDEKSHGVPDPSLRFIDDPVEIKASCKGLVCCKSHTNDSSYYICNPATKEWRVLPNPPRDHDSMVDVVLAFDPFDVPASYKLVCVFSSEYEFEFEIFDSKTDEWIIPRVMFTDDVLSLVWDTIYSTISVRGIIYWLVDPSSVVLSFDTDKNCCRSIHLPKLTAKERESQAWLGEFEGCLSYTNVVKAKGKVKVWILCKPSLGEWSLRYNVHLETTLEHQPELWRSRRAHLWTLPCQDGEVLLLYLLSQQELFVYYFKTQKLNKFPILPPGFANFYSYTNTMVRLPRYLEV
ncbi:F-box protein At5g49610-like [Tasmannia lanceolata]|uniref:F-box protein At5g49610-like n=1 Tax=Tasmannia lanceolata TaxID=3420 RepID=UPI004064A151